ncbi:hypothetical protein [Amycolatopsis taiwanensis]|uniref:Uncharacterized protein n=1 Tax=Amycolatopsis taiwanensis TaxID=342230 RepID=A0A9W6QY58_9PSEU|nr:hypothetical protein [Amycolatopsis taiwanensis]GLY64202.1 hypothetical protein Atai01_08210 [Amycolatopsis taiwanensis]
MTDPDREHRRDPDRRRLDEVFGDVLPETTSDERDAGAPERDRDSWYQENRPPHHE